MIYIDQHTEIGSTHKICQDCAFAGEIDGLTLAVISDGCSSAPNTDFGSRLLVQALKKLMTTEFFHKAIKSRLIEHSAFPEVLKEQLLGVIHDWPTVLQLHHSVFSATLVFAILSADRSEVLVCALGDGGFAYQYEGKPLVTTYFEYKQNAPYYLSYGLTAFGEEDYVTAFKDNGRTKWCSDSVIMHCAKTVPYCTILPRKDLRFITVMSDGASSYINESTGARLLSHSAMQHLSEYKNLKGEFVSRRLLSFHRSNKLETVVHQDDIAVAGISFAGTPNSD